MLYEGGDNASAGTQHVPETHRRDLSGESFGRALQAKFRHSLRRSHNVCRIDGFIGGNKYKLFNSACVALFQHVLGAENVVFNALVGGNFHHRNVFVSGGVENHVGTVEVHDFLEFPFIPYRPHFQRISLAVMNLFQFFVEFEHSVFVMIENNQVFAPVFQCLTTEFASYASRAPRNHNHFVFYEAVHQFLVHSMLVSVQKVLDFYISYAYYVGIEFALSVSESRRYHYPDVELLYVVEYASQFGLGKVGDGYRYYVCFIFFDNPFYFVAVAFHGNVADEITFLEFVVVDNRHGFVAVGRIFQ